PDLSKNNAQAKVTAKTQLIPKGPTPPTQWAVATKPNNPMALAEEYLKKFAGVSEASSSNAAASHAEANDGT
ncbi:hypothetical protein BGZ95_007583, partial [Linnemannia exigua]